MTVYLFRKGSPAEIYSRMSNKLINSSTSILGVINHINSLSECFGFCNARPRCHYVEVDSKSKCRFYAKEAYFDIRETPGKNRLLFEREQASKKVVSGIRLIEHYKGPLKNIMNEDFCWEKCLREKPCAAVTFNYTKSECFLFKKGLFNFTIEDEFVSVFSKQSAIDFSSKKNSKFSLHKNVRIYDYYKTLSTNTEYTCWSECEKESGCLAISFGTQSKSCYLINKNEYSVRSNYNFVSISLEDENSKISTKLAQNAYYRDYST